MRPTNISMPSFFAYNPTQRYSIKNPNKEIYKCDLEKKISIAMTIFYRRYILCVHVQ